MDILYPFLYSFIHNDQLMNRKKKRFVDRHPHLYTSVRIFFPPPPHRFVELLRRVVFHYTIFALFSVWKLFFRKGEKPFLMEAFFFFFLRSVTRNVLDNRKTLARRRRRYSTYWNPPFNYAPPHNRFVTCVNMFAKKKSSSSSPPYWVTFNDPGVTLTISSFARFW